MTKITATSLHKQIQNIKRTFLQVTGIPTTAGLSTGWLKKLAESVNLRRDTVYTPLVTLRIFLMQVLSDDGSCNAAVARFGAERIAEGEEAVSANSGPYCAARRRLRLDLLESGVRETGAATQKAAKSWKWRGHSVVIVDATTVLMPDTPDNQAAYPQQSTQKRGLGFPITRIGALISLASGAIIDYATAPYGGKGTGESSLLARTWGALQSGDLLLGDRYYATYAILARAISGNIDALMQTHANRKVDYRTGKRLGERDHLVQWKKPAAKPVWISDAEYAALPETITLREFRSGGLNCITTLIDAKRYPKKELSTLYKERWKIEVDFRSIKTHMGMEMLHCKTSEMVKKEIAVNFLAYNLIRNAILQSALAHDKEPRKISFRGTVQWLLASASSIVRAANKMLSTWVENLLSAISSNSVGCRSQSPQPRVVKRRPKSYPLMTKPRADMCLESQIQ